MGNNRRKSYKDDLGSVLVNDHDLSEKVGANFHNMAAHQQRLYEMLAEVGRCFYGWECGCAKCKEIRYARLKAKYDEIIREDYTFVGKGDGK